MKKEDLHPTLKQEYQVMRETISRHIIKAGLVMEITTFVRIYPYGTDASDYSIQFITKDNKITSYDEEIHAILKEKYFKPEMIQW